MVIIILLLDGVVKLDVEAVGVSTLTPCLKHEEACATRSSKFVSVAGSVVTEKDE